MSNDNSTAGGGDDELVAWNSLDHAWAWFFVLAVLGLVVACMARCGWVLRYRRAARSIQFERTALMVLRSSCIFLAMTVPLFCSSIRHRMPTNFLNTYHWLPFWYAFAVSARSASVIRTGCEATLGAFLGMLAAMVLNYLMPGGAGPLGRDPEFVSGAWLPGGYHERAAVLYALSFAYCVYLSRWSIGVKQYTVSTLAGIVVEFMNPEQDSEAFRAVLWDWHFNMNWGGPMLSQIYPLLLAVPLSALTLPVIPSLRCPSEQYSTEAMARKGLTNLMTDTTGCLKRLLTYFEEDALNFDVESSFFHITSLGAQRTAAEALLNEAEWQCFTTSAQARLAGLRRLCDLLRGLRQALRVQLDQLRGHSIARSYGLVPTRQRPKAVHTIKLFLEDFFEACSGGLAAAASAAEAAADGDAGDAMHQVLAEVSRADGALIAALEMLQQDGSDTVSAEMAFIDGLRTWPALIDRFCQGPPEDVSEIDKWLSWLSPSSWSPYQSCHSREQHVFALRNTTSFALALLWSIYVRSYRPGCVISVAFLFSVTLGSLLTRNVNRMVGVAMGIYVGNIPEALFMAPAENACCVKQQFIYYPQGFILYLAAMFIMWSVAMYGNLASGAKWSYACLLWAGFGGVQTLGRLKQALPLASNNVSKGVLFMDVMDNFAGCLIIFVVDVLFAYLTGGVASEQVARTLPECLDEIALLVRALGEGDLECGNGGGNLRSLIKEVRNWDVEVQKEDPVWTTPWKAPYKADFVRAMLNHCDEAYVATQALRESAERCDDHEVAAGILREVLPTSLACRAQTYSGFVSASLNGYMTEVTFNTPRQRMTSPDFGPAFSSDLSAKTPQEPFKADNQRPSTVPLLLDEAVQPQPALLDNSDQPQLKNQSRRPSGVRFADAVKAAEEEDIEGSAAKAAPIAFPDLQGDSRDPGDLRGFGELAERRDGQGESGRTGPDGSAKMRNGHRRPRASSAVNVRRTCFELPSTPLWYPSRDEANVGSGECFFTETAAEVAAEVALRTAAWALRLALQRCEVLIREQAFWQREAKGANEAPRGRLATEGEPRARAYTVVPGTML